MTREIRRAARALADPRQLRDATVPPDVVDRRQPFGHQLRTKYSDSLDACRLRRIEFSIATAVERDDVGTDFLRCEIAYVPYLNASVVRG